MLHTLRLFLFIIFISTTLQGQIIPQNPNQTDDKGLKQGKWTILYDKDWKVVNDTTQVAFYRTLLYQDNKPIGQVTDWYKNGKPQMVADSLLSEKPEKYEGNLTFYREDGSRAKVQVFKDGKEISQTFYNPDGSIAEANWESLMQQGLVFYEQGKYEIRFKYLKKPSYKLALNLEKNIPNMLAL